MTVFSRAVASPAVTGTDLLDQVIDRVVPTPGRTQVVAIAGPVAVGKSTIAGIMAERLRGTGSSVEILTTDGFLWPNAVLESRGLVERKGYPETYDLDRLDQLVAAARDGERSLTAPVYSHQRYDVLDEPATFDRPDVLVLEGVVALQRRFGDLGVYIDAATEDVEGWYVARFHELVRDAADDPDSFYRGFVDLDPADVDDLARAVWTAVNLPNLVDHIAPSKAQADVVIHKGRDHTIRSVDF